MCIVEFTGYEKILSSDGFAPDAAVGEHLFCVFFI